MDELLLRGVRQPDPTAVLLAVLPVLLSSKHGKILDDEGCEIGMAPLVTALKCGADPNAICHIDGRPASLLYAACKARMWRFVSRLLAHGTDANGSPRDPEPVLRLVLRTVTKHNRLWLALLRHGARADFMDADELYAVMAHVGYMNFYNQHELYEELAEHSDGDSQAELPELVDYSDDDEGGSDNEAGLPDLE